LYLVIKKSKISDEERYIEEAKQKIINIKNPKIRYNTLYWKPVNIRWPNQTDKEEEDQRKLSTNIHKIGNNKKLVISEAEIK
jgi:hypothetical protein